MPGGGGEGGVGKVFEGEGVAADVGEDAGAVVVVFFDGGADETWVGELIECGDGDRVGGAGEGVVP